MFIVSSKYIFLGHFQEIKLHRVKLMHLQELTYIQKTAAEFIVQTYVIQLTVVAFVFWQSASSSCFDILSHSSKACLKL